MRLSEHVYDQACDCPSCRELRAYERGRSERVAELERQIEQQRLIIESYERDARTCAEGKAAG